MGKWLSYEILAVSNPLAGHCLHIPGKQHNRSKGTACCSASNGIKPVNSYCA